MKKIFVVQYKNYGYGRQQIENTIEEALTVLDEWKKWLKSGGPNERLEVINYNYEMPEELRPDDMTVGLTQQEMNWIVENGYGYIKQYKTFNDEYANSDHSHELALFSVEYDEDKYEPINDEYDGYPRFELVVKNKPDYQIVEYIGNPSIIK